MAKKSKYTDWVDHEDRVTRRDRLARLRWLDRNFTSEGWAGLVGGTIAHMLYEEAKYCYVYAQFLATVLLVLAFIEHSLGGEHYMAGDDVTPNMGVLKLLHEAAKSGWYSEAEIRQLNKIRKFRNLLTHWRKPFHRERLDMRALRASRNRYSIAASDAKLALRAMFIVIDKSPLQSRP